MLSVEYAERIGTTLPHLSGGFFSQVYTLTADTVVKVCRGFSDGTRNWLEFCVLMQSRGEFMPGMPEVHCVVGLSDGGYMAVMRRYNDFVETIDDDGKVVRKDLQDVHSELFRTYDGVREFFMDTLAAFKAYLYYITGQAVADEDAWNDVHSGNVMYDAAGVPVVTDPSAHNYSTSYSRERSPKFTLEMQ